MANLVIAVIGVAFAAALALAGVNYMSSNVSVTKTEGSYITTEATQLLTDYATLQQNTGQTPSSTSYHSVYNGYSYNMPYKYSAGATPTMTSPSKVPQTGSGWLFNPTCGGAGNTPCFCLTIDNSANASAAQALYQAASSSAKKLTTGGGNSKITLNNSCTATGQKQYGQWPATPPQQYTLVVTPYTPTPAVTCTCTQGGATYLCNDQWASTSQNTQACSSGYTGGPQTQTCTTPYTCVSQGNPQSPGTTCGSWDTSQCVPNLASCNTATEGAAPTSEAPPTNSLCTAGSSQGASETISPPNATWNWTCTAQGGATATCQSSAMVDGVCHPYPNPTATAPGSSASYPECDAGTGAPTIATKAADSNWHWACNDYNGGQSPTCTAPGACAGAPPTYGSLSSFPTCAPSCPAGLTLSGSSCVCAAATLSWGNGTEPGNCSDKFPQTAPVTAPTLYNNTAAGYTGSAYISCQLTGWTFYGSPTCTAVPTVTCPATYLSWPDATNGPCSAIAQKSSPYTSIAMISVANGFVGTATALCQSDGSWQTSNVVCAAATSPQNGSCSTTPGQCNAGTASATSDSGSTTTWTCSGIGTGSTTASCSVCDTNYSLQNGSCVPNAVTDPECGTVGQCQVGTPSATTTNDKNATVWTCTANGNTASCRYCAPTTCINPTPEPGDIFCGYDDPDECGPTNCLWVGKQQHCE